jgi:hypothetical protein
MVKVPSGCIMIGLPAAIGQAARGYVSPGYAVVLNPLPVIVTTWWEYAGFGLTVITGGNVRNGKFPLNPMSQYPSPDTTTMEMIAITDTIRNVTECLSK